MKTISIQVSDEGTGAVERIAAALGLDPIALALAFARAPHGSTMAIDGTRVRVIGPGYRPVAPVATIAYAVGGGGNGSSTSGACAAPCTHGGIGGNASSVVATGGTGGVGSQVR